MQDFLINLFSSGSFIPHGHCYLWKPGLVWLHVLSDSMIGLAYYSIPVTLFYFVRKRQDLPFHWIFLSFAAFIIACGTTHFAEVWTLWYPTYWLSGAIKAGTALVSIFTAFELVPLVPKALALPSPSQLEQANQALQVQIKERLRIEEELRQFQNQLEQKVELRTAELVQVNQQLTQEIDERHCVEEALRKSEAKFRRLVDANIIGVISANVQGVITDANDAFLRMIGYTSEEVFSGKVRWDEMTPPDLKHLDVFAIEELLTCGATTPYEKEFFHKDGHRVPILLGAALVEDDPNNIISFILDITERKRVQQDLQQTLQTLSTLVQASPLPIIVIELDMTVKLWNAAAAKLFNWSEAEVVGQLLPFVPEEKEEECFQLREAVVKGEVFFGVETYRRKRDGSHVVLNISAAPLYDEGKSVNGILLILQDITQRKQAEVEREQLLVREKAAREQAEAANRIKDEFLAVLSHELRSPLNPILGWTKLLQSRNLDEQKTKQALATIERNARLQAQLIEDLLDVSRILQGKLVLYPHPVRLVSTIEGAIETVRLAAEAKGIQIQTAFTPNVGLVMGDSARLQQVMWNLLSNAVKFTNSGGKIDICVEKIKSEIQVEVKDTGKGINREFLPFVFEYFRQEDGTTTRKFGGLGLGLAIVRQLVELHGGNVTAESPGEGQGATFTVRLPLFKNETEKIADETNNFELSSLHIHPLQDVRVLLIDDEPDARDLIAFVLAEAGAIATAVSSAIEALTIFPQVKPDLIVSDIGMPEVDGYMLIQQIRALPLEQGGQVPAIALTAYAGEINQQKAIASGFQRHLAKPVETNELVETIISLVSIS
jgi:PAS domain S-box-containing protein